MYVVVMMGLLIFDMILIQWTDVGCNAPDAIVVVLATAAIGAIYTSLAGDMGENVG